MVERITGPTPVPSLRNCTGRHPDGDTVPQPPRPAPPDRRLRRTVLACAAVIALVLVARVVLTGVLQ